MNRREFLEGLGMAFAATSLGGCKTLTSPDFDASTSVLISDLHVKHDGFQDEFLCRTVDKILSMRPLPKNVVCFGDIAYLTGDEADYRKSEPILRRLTAAGITLTLGLGNHDRRSTFLKAWPEYRQRTRVPGYVVSEVDLGACDLLLLDTLHEPDTPESIARGYILEGQLNGAQRDWLLREVQSRRRPFFLGAHHQMDKINGRNWREINDLAFDTPLCIGWIHGHDHAWYNKLIQNSKTDWWGEYDYKRSLSLPTASNWGDVGYVVLRTRPGEARAELVEYDHFFPYPTSRKQLDRDMVEERQGQFMTFRWRT